MKNMTSTSLIELKYLKYSKSKQNIDSSFTHQLSITPCTNQIFSKTLVYTFSMLHSFHPPSLVRLTITISHDPKTIPFTISVFSPVCITIGPIILAVSMLLIVLPSTFVFLSIFTFHGSLSLKFIIFKHSLKNASFLHQNSLPMSPVIKKLAIVPTSIRINRLPLSVCKIVFPHPLVFIPRLIKVFTVAISYTVSKISLVVVAILLYIPTSPLTSSLNKLPF